MADVLDSSALVRWRANPVSFIQQVLHNPESGKPFELLGAELVFLQHAFKLDENGKLLYNEWLYSCPKKSGKTTFAAIIVITVVLLYGGSHAEAICCANAFEQSIARVYHMIRCIIECSPLLRGEARITQNKITIAGATIIAIPSDYASAAGSNQNIAVFDELWAFSTEGLRRLFDELTPPPTRRYAIRLIVTYAGFSGESVLLEEIYKRGMALPEIAPDLRGGDGLLMFWSHTPVAPWQTPEWIEQQRKTQRPSAFARQILNEFASSGSAFVDLSAWDACVQPSLTPIMHNRQIHVWVGVDASTKRDGTALVAVTFDKKTKCVRLIAHHVFTPTPGDPIDFEATVERLILDWSKRYRVRKILFDPFQMVAVAQRLAKAHIQIEEYAQTVPNLTAVTSNLFDLIQSRQLVLYPDPNMRLAMSRTIIVESSRGWRIDKLKQHHKIDVIVALAMAAFAAVQGHNESSYDTTYRGFDPNYRDPDAPPPTPGWKLRGFGSRAEAEAYKMRMRAQFGPTVSFAWDFD